MLLDKNRDDMKGAVGIVHMFSGKARTSVHNEQPYFKHTDG